MKAFPKLYKRTTTGKIQEWEIFVDGDKFWTISGQQGGSKITHDPTVCIPKNTGKTNGTSPEQQAYNEAVAKWKKQTEKHYSVNLSEVDETSFFKVMLAKNYNQRPKDKIDWKNAFISPKLDGIRFVATNTQSLSRNGKPLGGGDYLRERFDKLFAEYPTLILDGELYNHDFKDDFNTLVSMIKRDRDHKSFTSKINEIDKYLQYHVYDVPVIGNCSSYTARMDAFKELLLSKFPDLKPYIKLVPYEKVYSHDEAIEKYEKYVEDGYEGAIMRFNYSYENKRTWNLLKLKEFDDAEFEIVEVLEGVGKKANTAGSLTLKLPNGTKFNSNIKGGYSLYDQIWAERESLVGKAATIQFFRYTEYGIPRFPYAIKINRESYE